MAKKKDSKETDFQTFKFSNLCEPYREPIHYSALRNWRTKPVREPIPTGLPRDYPYASENCDTLEAFCNLFRIVCTNYRYDSCTYAYRFYTKHEADTEELSGVRLLAYLYNNFHAGLYKPKVYWTKDRKKRRRSRISVTCECPFTGVVSDEIILQPLMDFMRSPDTRNFKELMRDCLENFFRSCRDDCEYCESEEYFTDESHRNNWEYLIDGTLFKETA